MNKSREAVQMTMLRDDNQCCGELPYDIYSLIEMEDMGSLKRALEEGADVNISNYPVEWTPLHLAVFSNNREAACILISYGARVDARDRMHNTPLHWAVLMKRPRELLELLISNGADVNSQGKGNKTPLDHALVTNLQDIISILLEHGAY